MQQRWLQNGTAGASAAFSSADYRLFTHAVAAESMCSLRSISTYRGGLGVGVGGIKVREHVRL